MTSALTQIYDVEQEQFAYSSTGELGTRFVSSCVAIVVVFSDQTVMVEHRTDIELCTTGDCNEAYQLFENITENIRQIKGTNFCIQSVFVIGGCEDEVKNDFSTSLISVRNDCLQSGKDPSDSPNTCLMHDLIAAIKIIEVKWSVPDDEKYDKNEPSIDVVIARHHQVNYLFVRQCVSLINNINGNKKRVCCGILSYNLNDANINPQQSSLSLTGAQFFVPNNLAENFKEDQTKVKQANLITPQYLVQDENY